MRVSTAATALAVPVCHLPCRSPLRRRRRFSPCFNFKDIFPARSSIDVASTREGSSSLVEAVPLREGADQAAGCRSEEAMRNPPARRSQHVFSSAMTNCSLGLIAFQLPPSEALAAFIPEEANPSSHMLQSLVLMDLDPGTAKLAISILGPFLSAYGFLFILRIVMSWYPKLPVGKFPYVLAYAPTEPLLFLTRKVIPPLGGVDVTPVVWFGLISFLNEILVGPQGLLVLLSRQV